jgi:ERCC4-related helicase
MMQSNIDDLEEGEEKEPLKSPMRKYQKRIVKKVGRDNALIVLPTGAGKTRIAAEIIVRAACTKKGMMALFLVPTTLLVRQQCESLRRDTNRLVSIAMFDM